MATYAHVAWQQAVTAPHVRGQLPSRDFRHDLPRNWDGVIQLGLELMSSQTHIHPYFINSPVIQHNHYCARKQKPRQVSASIITLCQKAPSKYLLSESTAHAESRLLSPSPRRQGAISHAPREIMNDNDYSTPPTPGVASPLGTSIASLPSKPSSMEDRRKNWRFGTIW
jgi:hypothetical protein